MISDSGELVWIEATPTIETSAYAAGDLIGEKLTLSNAVSAGGGGGLIQSVALVDLHKQDAAVDVVFFHTDPTGTTFTDNSALDVADADLANVLGVVSITEYFDFSDNALGLAQNLALPFVLPSDATALYAAIVSRGTPQYSAAGDLNLRVGVIRT